MSSPAVPFPTPHQPDRWPARIRSGVIILFLAIVLGIVPGLIWPRTNAHFISFFAAPLIGSIALVVWWGFRAKLRGWDRLLLPALLIVPTAIMIAVNLNSGTDAKTAIFPVVLYYLPGAGALAVLWLVCTNSLPRESRRLGLIAVVLAGWGVAALLRYDGNDGDLLPAFHWRWNPSAEDRFEAERATRAKASLASAEIRVQPGDWPAFRGPEQNSQVKGVSIQTDWVAHPPKELWRHRVGPGWGSFAVVGDRLFTQEQRGPDEAVVCYDANTGNEVWEYRHPTRFSEAMGGVGPRGTPTVHDGFVYAQGATGKLVCLEAATGKPRWMADVTANPPGGTLPPWAYSGSPLVIQGVVIVYAGAEGKGTAAYKADTGELAWAAGHAAHSYSSAHRATFGGVEQALMISDHGIESFHPADGALLWEHAWFLPKGMNRSTQPAILNDTDLVFTTGVGNDQGTRRIRVMKTGTGWDVKPVWTSRALKPYYNDGVVYRGHLYGFDGPRFCCIDLETGKLAWKDDGAYGHGQVLLLADQGVLLVQAVDGKVALVEASKDGPDEIAKIDALQGKTWNHPVVAHGKLFVRNAEYAACYQFQLK